MMRLLVALGVSAFVLVLVAPRLTAADVGAPNQPPVARVDDDLVRGFASGPVCFDASKSYDSEGRSLTYRWDFGDGRGTAAVAKACHEYADEGLYAATVTVTDDGGLTSTARVVVSVAARTAPGM